MTDYVTVVRENKKFVETEAKIENVIARYKGININDTVRWSNQGESYTRKLANMFELARVITIGEYNHNESRGADYKPEVPNRDDANFLNTTMAKLE
ncbi:succinate dehydrogenase, partial [Bacillus cereus]|nr:succinate dehydrogenase [Bacillus cereus]